MSGPVDLLEAERMRLQAALDAMKTPEERNRLGQFATPPRLARELVALGISHLPSGAPLRFFDPAVGMGSFYSALRATAGSRPVEAAVGVEVDPHYREPSRLIWEADGLEVRAGDFTRLTPDRKFNLLICNPPYVRHHHLDAETKARLRRLTAEVVGLKVSGLAGLYVFFLLLSLRWMAPGGVAVWLVPSEFLDVNYGLVLKRFLLEHVTLLRVHRAAPEARTFADALVSSAVVVFRNTLASSAHQVELSVGGELIRPALTAMVECTTLATTPKWTRYPAEANRASPPPTGSAPGPVEPVTRLGDWFDVRRGIATGDNHFFIVGEARLCELGLPAAAVKAILPGPRRLLVEEVLGDAVGLPNNIERYFLLDTGLSPAEVGRQFPKLWAYLSSGEATTGQGYLCRRRSPWYAQEQRPAAPIVCTYMGRGGGAQSRPFRFIRNRTQAVATNGYLLLYPRPELHLGAEALDRVWRHLSGLDPQVLLREGRVYGGGLYKLEPRELAAVPLPLGLVGPAAASSGRPGSR